MRRLLLVLACTAAVAACGKRSSSVESDERPIVKAEPTAPRNPTGDDIEYTVSFEGAANHYVDVTALFPTEGAAELELMMAVWTPGSYMVREYARHLEGLSAASPSGEPLALTKVRKNRWKVTTAGNPRVAVRYRIYAREWTVRTNFVDADMAMLNGAPTFLTLAGDGVHRHDIAFRPLPAWTHVMTALPPHPGGDANRFLAPDFDTVVDSPVVIGSPENHVLDVEGVEHVLATFGGGDVWEGKRAADDVRTLIAEQLEFWGIVPYERYVFLNVLGTGSGGGGLEHKDSTLMILGRWYTRKRADYLRWLGLVSHELFHTWNAKRLRPVELGPFDYENEVHTRSLWVVEGITSYYDDLLLRRAGLMTHREYLEKLSGNIEELEKTPGRKLQPLSRSSYDAWIKYYRGDENSGNSSISYYTKGAVVAFLLDAEIRKRTFGRKSLDHVMRAAYERYAGDKGYTPDEFRLVAEEIAGSSLERFWTRYVDGTDELDYGPAFDYLGLRFRSSDHADAKPKKDAEPPAWLGAKLSGLVVRQVPRDTPAFRAGLNKDDELIAIDGQRLTSLDARLARYRPGDKATILLARRGTMRELPVTFDRKPEPKKVEIASDDLMTAARRKAWLGPDSTTVSEDEDEDEDAEP